MIRSVPAGGVWPAIERDPMLLREFEALHIDARQALALVGTAVIALGEERPARDPRTAQVFAAPRWGVQRWLAARLGVGPRLASAIVRVALNAASAQRVPADLRAVAGRIEVHAPDPQRLRAVR